MKNVLWLVSVLLALVLGMYLMSVNWLPWSKPKIDESSTILLEQIEKVAKLVTVDGHFSEIYNYKDYYGYDWSIFRKKALIRVQAMVSVGYDLSNIDVEANPSRKEIIISNLPQPKILSIDHDLDYYDLREGTFNSFTKDDLNKLNQQAKNYVEQAAAKSNLLKQASERGHEMIETMRFLVEANGWKLVINETPINGHFAN